MTDAGEDDDEDAVVVDELDAFGVGGDASGTVTSSSRDSGSCKGSIVVLVSSWAAAAGADNRASEETVALFM